MIRTFSEYLDKKQRDTLKHLGIVKKLLERNGMKVESFLDTDKDDEPYIFCYNPSRNTSFDGVRIYKIGSSIAFRIQKENQTHPYGKAYPLQIEEMFNDMVGEKDADQKEVGQKVIELVAKEIKKFFERSVEAEKDERRSSIDGYMNAGNVLVRTTGTDYSSLVHSKTG